MLVFVVNQNTEGGRFDEHKCMLGFESKDEAVKAYDAAFTGDLGPKLRGSVVSTTMANFKEWLKSGKTKKPFEPNTEALDEALGLRRADVDRILGKINRSEESRVGKEGVSTWS